MRYYSDVTKKVYNTEKDLILDERKAKEDELQKQLQKQEAEKAKKAERTARAKEVEKALKDASEAQTKALALLRKFSKDYGYYHMSVHTNDEDKTEDNNTTKNSVNSLLNLINSFIDMSF